MFDSQVQIGPEFFKKAKQDYSSWRYAFVRELMQNAIDSGALEIKVGKHFNISITEDPGDITLMKSDIKSNDVNVFKSYITDEPETIMWESAITVPEFHFYTIQKASGNTYVIQDVISADGSPSNKEQIQKMLDSAKKLVAKPKPNA